MMNFDELFAYRIQYQDYNDDENYIIRKLKILLYNNGENMIDINHHIYNFYNHFNIIGITLHHIESIIIYEHININNLFQNLIQTLNNNQINEQSIENRQLNNGNRGQLEENEIFFFEPYLSSSLDEQIQEDIPIVLDEIFFFEPYLSSSLDEQIQEDIPLVLDDIDYNNLIIKKYNCENNNNCTICLCNMEKDDEYYKIKCNHYFHKDCLDTWITDYSYICPICREEIGQSQPLINDINDVNDVNDINDILTLV